MAKNINRFVGLFALALALILVSSGTVFAANTTQNNTGNITAADYWNVNSSCGWYGSQCCANQTCYAGLDCNNGTCMLNLPTVNNSSICGKSGQLCCGGTTCYSGLVCGGGLCQIRDYYNGTSCGWHGLPCCGGDVCYTGLTCSKGACLPPVPSAKNNSTVSCGGANQKCCSTGNACLSGLGCSSGKCMPKCATGQTNCLCGYNPAPCSSSTYCDASSQNCLPACKIGVTTGSCVCLAPGSAPSVLWWGVCGTKPIAANNSSSNPINNANNTTIGNANKIIAVSLTAQPSAYGQVFPTAATGYYGTNMGIRASPATGYQFDGWSGNCQVTDQYEQSTTVMLSSSSGCSLVAAFSRKTATPCGGAAQPCCSGSTCNATFVCMNGICKAPVVNNTANPSTNQTPADNNTNSGGSPKPPAKPAPCGDDSQPCCDGKNCNGNATCIGGTCKLQTVKAAVQAANNSTPQKCAIGDTNCQCGYGAVCSSSTYCDTSSQNCFPECQQGVTTGSCICRANNASPYMMWWGVCGTPAAPVCGAANQSCCNGITCNSGLGCVSGKCTSKCAIGQSNCACGYSMCNSSTYCDTASQLCFPACQYGAMSAGCMCMPQGSTGTPSVIWWGVCGTIPPCGGANQSCCTANACNSGYTCQSGTCRTYVPSNNTTACGGAAQPCCTTGTACTASGYTCQSGTCKAYVPPANNSGCGNAGQLCCAGTTCNSGLACGGGICQLSQYYNGSTCGYYGIQCCGGDVCYTGYQCDHGTCLIQLPPETDASTCGKAGQLCCGGTTCYSNLICGGGLCQWRQYYNSTICGWWGGQCCGGSVCYTGTSCTTNGICMPNANGNNGSICGGANQQCCPGESCNSGYTCNLNLCQPYTPPANNTTIITLYTVAKPGGNGLTYPAVTTGLYGSVRDIEAEPAMGYVFDSWSGNCPIADMYEKITTMTLTPGSGTICQAVATFPNETTVCGASGRICCIGNVCNSGLTCNVTSGLCGTASNVTVAPDLTVLQINIPSQAQVGVRVYGNFHLTNIGNGPAGNSTTSYYIDNVIVNSVDTPALAAGGAYDGIVSFICQRTGTYTFMVRADAGNVIAERNEGNNEQAVTFVCLN